MVFAAHVVLWRYLFTKALIATKVGALFFRRTVAVPFHAATYYSHAFQDTMQDRFDKWLDSKMNILGEKLKDLLKDPYMPEPLRQTIDDAVDLVLPDLKLALFIKTDEYITFRAPTAQRFVEQEEREMEREREREEIEPVSRFQPNRDMNVLDLDKILEAITVDGEEKEMEMELDRGGVRLTKEEILFRIKRVRFHVWGVKEFVSFGISVRGMVIVTDLNRIMGMMLWEEEG